MNKKLKKLAPVSLNDRFRDIPKIQIFEPLEIDEVDESCTDPLNKGFTDFLNISEENEQLTDNEGDDTYLDLDVDCKDFYKSHKPKKQKFQSVNDVFAELESLSAATCSFRGISHQRIQKLIAAYNTQTELEKVVRLVESHVPNLRDKTAVRYARLLTKELKTSSNEEYKEELNLLKENIIGHSPTDLAKTIETIKRQVAEMPKEWNIIQITSHHTEKEAYNLNINIQGTNQLHITVFNCGQDLVDPFVITVDAPYYDGKKLELMQKLTDTFIDYQQNLKEIVNQKRFKNVQEKREYVSRTENTEVTLKEIIKRLEENWLRQWRCLLIGKYQDKSLEKNIRDELEKIYNNQLSKVVIPPKTKELMHYVTKGAGYLLFSEVQKALSYCLNKIVDENTIKEISQLIKEINIAVFQKSDNHLRHPIILIVDECLDSFPWEMLTILTDQPVTRLPSLYFAHLLFKSHEKEIQRGDKIVRSHKNGKYLLNPDSNLPNMEIRIQAFLKYWLPNWTGIINKKPTKEEFFDLVTAADIYSYYGHGNGSHLMSLDFIQKCQIGAVVMLFGCASNKLTQKGAQVEMYSSYYLYLMARSPCVFGMLWPVTDMYTDLLTTEFLSTWLPSSAERGWSKIDKQAWMKTFKIKKLPSKEINADIVRIEEENNLELLRALSQSKKRTNYLTKAACVVRGLPIKIELL
ncbi:unnamed protein product [Ceutorhynchus assimilis]|uniref:separase n=1 Tax=Ceutorhynchus assimilis TaxID=467358 RepID=A0A9N9ML93_9CUCU|nr:unnamed protein product [Ceutorhynchus assimilis]